MRAWTILAGVGMGGWMMTAAETSETTGRDRRTFWFGVFLGAPLVALLWLWWYLRCEDPVASEVSPELPIDLTRVATKPPPTENSRPAPPAPDDLRRIEGIGPKVSQLLQNADILTYAQLSASAPQRLKKILDEAGLRFIDPGTWPEQAALAAQGDWDKLVALQDKLKGGRRV